MKKIMLLAGALIVSALGAAEVPLYPVVKKSTPVEKVAFENNNGSCRLAFKVAAGTKEDFAVGGVYVFTDTDRKTGRKGIGNEYFFDVPKKMVSTYAADGKGKLHRKAVNAERNGDWYILTFSDKLAPENPMKEFEIVFNIGKKRDRAVLRGAAPEKVEIPAGK